MMCIHKGIPGFILPVLYLSGNIYYNPPDRHGAAFYAALRGYPHGQT